MMECLVLKDLLDLKENLHGPAGGPPGAQRQQGARVPPGPHTRTEFKCIRILHVEHL